MESARSRSHRRGQALTRMMELPEADPKGVRPPASQPPDKVDVARGLEEGGRPPGPATAMAFAEKRRISEVLLRTTRSVRI